MPPFDAAHVTSRTFPDLAQTTRVTRLMAFGPWTRVAQDRVREFAALPEGWDGKNSLPLQEKARSRSFGVIDALTKLHMSAPHIVPIPDGGLQLEWHKGSRGLEIEVNPDGSVGFLVEDAEGAMLSGDIVLDNNLAALTPLTVWFLDSKARVSDLTLYAPY
jgi:hypothetical protein